MNVLNNLAASPVIAHWVMTLLHSLWQGALIAALLGLGLRGIRSANHRYVVSLMSLVLLVLAVFVTYGTLERPLRSSEWTPTLSTSQQPSWESPSPADTPLNHETASTEPPSLSRTPIALNWQHHLFVLWSLGVCVMWVRMGMLLGGSLALRNQTTVCDDPKRFEQIERLQTLLGMSRRIGLAFSRQVLVPCTVGILRPVILLPTTMTGMDPEDAEAILLHELAHIQRLDWLVNIVQLAIESVLFFNPAVWWISRQIRIEREAACDQVAIQRSEHPGRYAECLVRFAAIQCHRGHAAALALSSQKRGPLTERLQRLLVPGYRPTVLPGIVPVLLSLVALACCGIGTVKTTQATLRYFGEHMTPQQRAETVAALTKDYHADNQQADLPEDLWIQVKGKIVTPEGLTPNIYSGLQVNGYRESSMQNVNKDGTFEFSFPQNRFTVSFVCPGYATQHISKDVKPGTKIEDWIITLEKGYNAFIQCTDPQGHPIEGVRITGGYPSPPDYSGYTNSIDLTSDANGLVTFDNASEALMALDCQAPGYAKSSLWRCVLHENEIKPWILQPSRPTEIVVTDKNTGNPIAGAQIHVWGKEFSSSFRNEKGETQTDADGRAVLASLVPEETYSVMIRPAKKQRQYVTLSAGQSLQVECGPVRPIRGRIIGDLSRLRQQGRVYTLSSSDSHFLKQTQHYDGGQTIIANAINDHEATFELNNYYGQKVTLNAGGESVILDIDGSNDLENVLINLSPETSNPETTNKITFNFNGLDQPSISNDQSFILSYLDKERGHSDHEIAIKDGQASVDITLPNTVAWKPVAQSPFFFKFGRQRMDENRDYTVDIECLPAGTIFGTVNVPPEACYQPAFADLKFLNKDKLQKTGSPPYSNINMTSEVESKFMFSPLPLEGHYFLIFYTGNMFIITEEIKFKPNQPLCEISLPWPENPITLRGRILDHTGQPVRGVDCSLYVNVENDSHGFSEVKTDAEGRFVCTGVNPDKRLSYSIRPLPGNAPWMSFPLKSHEKPTPLKLEKGIIVRGVLKDHSGQLRPNVRIWFRPHQSNTHYCYQEITTDSEGRFEVTLGDTEYDFCSNRKIDSRSWKTDTVTIHPGKDQDVVLVSDQQ